MKTSRLLSLTIFLSAIAPTILLSQSLKIKSVRIWDSEKANFGPVSDLEVQKGKVHSITLSKDVQNPQFILPGFCDASVTLGANSLGGKSSREDIPQRLQGFLAAGFSHVESVGDPDLGPLLSEIQKSKWNSPILSQTQRPIVYDAITLETTAQYQSGFPKGKDSKRNFHTPIFLKEKDGEGFSQTDLFQFRKDSEARGEMPIVYTFADKTSWEDALDTGFSTIFHPMPKGTNLARMQTRDFYWSPMMATLYLPALKAQGLEAKSEWEDWSKSHALYRDVWKSQWESGLSESADENLTTLAMYEDAVSTFKALSPNSKLLFASGSGHYGLFPGQAAIVEIGIWEKTFPKSKTQSQSFYGSEKIGFFTRFFGSRQRQIRKVADDPETLFGVRRAIIQILTKDTCQFLGANHAGVLKVGSFAHFSIWKENPLKRREGIFPIESMVLGGKLVYTHKPQREGTAK
ncbi:hypothetical protein P3G55_21440 [Leptospira sp. 96542]|nr:hypothetical protein [Leptospira sp. 96542]